MTDKDKLKKVKLKLRNANKRIKFLKLYFKK